jgi:hypothetical protein|tara:strand:+ start:566 stop:901 length:336 start_codon:yes stop_codon:yes gene_type:complete
MINPKFHKLLEEIADLHDKKNTDYANATDCLSNLKGCSRLGLPPMIGTIIRMQDKWGRIENFCKNGFLVNESLRDSLIDNAVYSLLAVTILDEEFIAEVAKDEQFRDTENE